MEENKRPTFAQIKAWIDGLQTGYPEPNVMVGGGPPGTPVPPVKSSEVVGPTRGNGGPRERVDTFE
jgi:hypothetical protein